jgi:hypothetical protein
MVPATQASPGLTYWGIRCQKPFVVSARIIVVVSAVIGITLIQSGITGFCPVDFALDRLLPSEGLPDASGGCAK